MSGRNSKRVRIQRDMWPTMLYSTLAWGTVVLSSVGCDSKGGGGGERPGAPRPEGNVRPGQPTPAPDSNGNGAGNKPPPPDATPTSIPGTSGSPGTPGTTPPTYATPGPTAAPTEPSPSMVPSLPEPAARVQGEPPVVRPEPSLVSRFVLTCDAARIKKSSAHRSGRQPDYTADERTAASLFEATETSDCRDAAEKIQRQEWVDVSGKGLTSPDFLGMAVSAKTLLLRDNRFGDLSALAPLVGLRFLSLSKNPVESLRPLANLRWLETLAVSDTALSRGSLDSLSQLGRLKRLTLKGAHLSTTDIRVIGSLAGLEEIDLRGVQFEAPADTALLARLTAMRKLDLAKSNASTLAFAASFEKLEELDASGTRLGELPSGARWRSLRTLIVADTKVSNIEDFVQTSSLPEIKTLILKGTKIAQLRDLSKVDSILYLNFEDTPAARSDRCPYDNWDVCER